MIFERLIIIIYSLVLFLFYFQFAKIKEKSNNPCHKKNFVSVIVPIKNEKENIKRLYKEFTNQTIKLSNFEVIFVDDNSTDGSLLLLNSMIRSNENIKIIKSEEERSGKKYAMITAAKNAIGEFLIFTDADTYHDKYFIENWIDFICNKPDFLLSFGNVIFKTKEKSFLTFFQSFEFAVLQAVGIATSVMKITSIGSAANMAVNRDFFISNVDALRPEVASGDDMFLLIAANKKDRKKVIWNTKSYVYTQPQKTIKGFVKQRLRWVGKSKYYDYLPIILLSSIAFLANISFVVLVLFGLTNLVLWSLLFLKIMAEIILLTAYNKKIINKKLGNKLFLLLSAILYPFYALLIIPIALVFSGKKFSKGFS
jgi:cellulose synthase/poly-beta-1,6-N-acetylglucosamine synthase-like glycosyltransferase